MTRRWSAGRRLLQMLRRLSPSELRVRDRLWRLDGYHRRKMARLAPCRSASVTAALDNLLTEQSLCKIAATRPQWHYVGDLRSPAPFGPYNALIMQVIEAQCLLVLAPHDHLHIKHKRKLLCNPRNARPDVCWRVRLPCPGLGWG